MKLGLYVPRETYCGINEYQYQGTEKSIEIVKYPVDINRSGVDEILTYQSFDIGTYYKHIMLTIHENE